MALVDVTKCCLDSISQISEHIGGSILYLDAGCTESFQFIGAFPLLLDLGVRAVCSLENMCSLDSVVNWNSSAGPARKVVVITSRLLSDAHRYILRCLSAHQGVRHCIIFTSIAEGAHSAYPDSPLGPDAFPEYESLLVQDYDELVKKSDTKPRQSEDKILHENLTFEEDGWSQLTFSEEGSPNVEADSSGKITFEENAMGSTTDEQKLIVSVHHFPLILCPISPRVFVLPSEGSVAEAYLSAELEDSLSPGFPPLSTGLLSNVDDVPPGATLTAHFLYHLASKMDLKMDIFSLGDMSKCVGKIMTDMSSLYDVGRRKRSAGLLLIDRTLDLLTPCCHGDSLVDRMFSSLPRRERISPGHIKGSKSQPNLRFPNLHRAPLDFEIPVAEILSEGDGRIENVRLLEHVEAFLCGWDRSSAGETVDGQIIDLIHLRDKVHGEKSSKSLSQLLIGSFVSTENFNGTPYLEAILDRRTKDGAILVKKWLQETLRREKISVNEKIRPGYATKKELLPMIKALAKRPASLLRNKGIIQLAAAAVTALDESHSARWDAFASAEKVLSIHAGDTSQSLAAQIGDLINKSALEGSSKGLLSFQDVLLLTAVGYMLAGENFPTSGPDGPFSWQEEHLLKEAIVDVILENPSLAKLKFLGDLTEELEANINKRKSKEGKEASDELDIDDFDDDQWGKWGDEDAEDSKNDDQAFTDMQLKLELRDKVDNLFKFFHKLSSLKRKNLPLREAAFSLDSGFGGDTYTSKGLLHKLLTRILGKYDVPQLEYHSSTVGRLFKSGFGRFGLGQAKPNLADLSVILVFVVGGINALEVHEVQEALSESGRPDIELILGGTTLLTPDDMLDSLLGQSSYF